MNKEEIHKKISIWMSELFDNNVTRSKVDEYIQKLASRIVATKLKKQEITEQLFKQLCESIENEH